MVGRVKGCRRSMRCAGLRRAASSIWSWPGASTAWAAAFKTSWRFLGELHALGVDLFLTSRR
jgi:hypothetical protein